MVGGSYYWLVYLRDFALSAMWPHISYREGCAGGDARIVLVGYATNAALLFLFLRFYDRVYHPRSRSKGGKDS